MATSTSVASPGCIVLRVKRKREEDPADALVVAKHSKLDSGTSVFQFVGTLKEDACDSVILDKLKHYRDYAKKQLKSNPFSRLSLEETRAQTREVAKNKSSAQRFKVVSELRCLQDNDTGSDSQDTECVRTEDRGIGDTSELIGRNVHICDAMQSKEEWPTVGAVTCNDAVMIREKVSDKTADYVYDLYYTQEQTTFDMETATFDWSSLSLYESEFVHDIIENEEIPDDEDDSNDEDNWRNDYPDEEGSTHTTDSEQYDDEDYRNRQALYDSDEGYGMDD